MEDQVIEIMDTQKELLLTKESKMNKYQKLVIGSPGYYSLIKYELINLFSSWIPGAPGLLLRSKLYPLLLKRCGKNVIFGNNVVLRHPHKISIGDNVVIDDSCVIDAKGETNKGILIDNNVFIGRNSIVYCQNGDISIGQNTNIGSNCQVFSAKVVEIRENVLIGAYSYLIGGGHRFDEVDIPMIQQGRIARGIFLEENVWVGAAVKILDDVRVGKASILGTGTVVTHDVPSYAIVGGVPAKVIRDRRIDSVKSL